MEFALNCIDTEAEIQDKACIGVIQELTYFHSKSEAPFSLMQFSSNLCVSLRSYAQSPDQLQALSENTTYIAVIYIKRLTNATGKHLLNRLTKHRLFLTAFLLAMKFHFDIPVSNKCYATQICQISLFDLNRMEIDFLERIDWRLKITPEELLQNQVFEDV